jgi:hypothetical protein
MGLKKGLILCMFLVSCGTKKKSVKNLETKTIKEVLTKTTNIKTDSSIYYLDISELKIVSRDSTKPIILKDSKGYTQTFYNVKYITSKKDQSVLKTSKNDSMNITQTSTVGQTISYQESIKEKESTPINYWYLIIPFVVYMILRQFLKRYI